MAGDPGFQDVRCSFCQRHNREVHMVAKDDLRICQVCVARCGAVLDQDAGVVGPEVAWLQRWPLKARP